MIVVFTSLSELLDSAALAFFLLLALGVLGVGRLTRLITYDAFPPAVWWRTRWAKITDDGPWEKLFSCYWCLAPWIAAVAIIWGILALEVVWLGVAWLVFWGWLGLSYVVSMIVNRDERE